MEIKVFTIYDEKAEAYLQPFFSDTHGLAIRSITDLVNDPNHNFCKYAADFTLFQIGTFDNKTGMITEDRQSLGSLVEYKTMEV
jgi:hypothetical protein